MLATIIIIIFGLTTATTFYFLPTETKWACAIPFTVAVCAFIIRRGINEWWYSKFPPKLAGAERDILARFLPYYKALHAEHKAIFEQRLAIFRIQKEFQIRGATQLPGDIQLLMSAVAVQFIMGFPDQKEFYPELGMVVMFPKTFITPDYHKQLHAIELNQDNYNCLLLSINMFVHGLTKPSKYYHTGLHGFAKAWKIENGIKDSDIPCKDRKELLVKLHRLRGFKLGYQFEYTSLPDLEVFEMCVEHFFQTPQRMQKELPEVYAYLMNLLLQDPANKTNPIIQHPVPYPPKPKLEAPDTENTKSQEKGSTDNEDPETEEENPSAV